MPISEFRMPSSQQQQLGGLQRLLGQPDDGLDLGGVGGVQPPTHPGALGGRPPTLTSDPGYPNPGAGGLIDNPAYPGGSSAGPRDYKFDAPRLPFIDRGVINNPAYPGGSSAVPPQQIVDGPALRYAPKSDAPPLLPQPTGADLADWGAPPGGGLQRLLTSSGRRLRDRDAPPAPQNVMGQVPAPGVAPGLPRRPSAFERLRATYGGPGSPGWRAYKNAQQPGALDSLRGR